MQKMQKHSVYPKSGRAPQICFWKSQKYRKHGLGPIWKVRSLREVNRRRGQHTVCLLDESLVSSRGPAPFSSSVAIGWVLLQIVQDSIFKSILVELLSFQSCNFSSVLKSGAAEQRMLPILPKSRNNSCPWDASTTGSSWDLGCMISILPEIKYHEEALSCLVVANSVAWGCAVMGEGIYLF